MSLLCFCQTTTEQLYSRLCYWKAIIIGTVLITAANHISLDFGMSCVMFSFTDDHAGKRESREGSDPTQFSDMAM